jgi:hypothetical protein
MSNCDDGAPHTPPPVKPLHEFYSSNLNPKITTYEKLATRIAYTLGYPQINIEAHQNQVFENISIAIEMFSKFAGYTEEYLTFHSSLYEPGKGLRMDVLMTATEQLAGSYEADPNETTLDKSLYEIGNSIIGGGPIDMAVNYKGYPDGESQWEGTKTRKSHGSRTSSRPDESQRDQLNEKLTKPFPNMKGYDYLTDSYRKVIDIFAFEEGTSTGINTLFTIEQTLAQQTYFSYALGKYGFDLVSWYTMKNWLEDRRKMLSQDYYCRFDDRKQTLYLTPEPNRGNRRTQFYGLIGAYVERPVCELVSEAWVYQYALALTKIVISRVRGKYSGTNLFGGGSPNYNELLSEGNTDKKELETKLYEGVPGFGDGEPPMFFVG